MRTAYATAYTGYPVTVEIETLAAHVATLGPATKAALMFAVAPLLGLVFVITLPLAGLVLVAWLAVAAAIRHGAGVVRVVKRVGLFLLAPFIALVYLIAFPFVGIGVLAYHGTRAVRRHAAV